MSTSIKLISLNIERSKHLDPIIPFLEREQPDVFCAQELLQSDVSRVQASAGFVDSLFTPMSRLVFDAPGALYGTGIFSRTPLSARGEQYYVGRAEVIPESQATELLTYNDENRAIAWADVEKDGLVFRIATTHFTWTPDGSASDEQRRDMRGLINIVNSLGECVLSGDFNAPRGLPGQRGEIFAMLSQKFKDNIPLQYTTSLDGVFHRAGYLNLMVDGLFSTPGYEVSDVRLVDGVSDHMAIVATISKS